MTQTPLQSPLVDFNVVDTNFEKWAKPGQFLVSENVIRKLKYLLLGTRKFFILKTNFIRLVSDIIYKRSL